MCWSSRSSSRAVIALVITGVCVGCAYGSGARPPRDAGFWFAEDALVLPESVTARLGGPLTVEDGRRIEAGAREELARAFQPFRIRLTDDRRAFWRVEVRPTLGGRRRQLPSAGESLAMGPFGGRGAVSMLLVAIDALHYADAAAARDDIVDAIGRGIGRVAVHEFAHQILGATPLHNDRDEDSYEYPSPDRRSQYYGELHWTTAQALLEKKLGVAEPRP